MEDVLRPLAEQFAFNSTLLSGAFSGLDDAAASRAPAPNANPIKWICGHIVTGRHQIASLLGATSSNPPWDGLFADSTVGLDPASLPAIAHVEQRLTESSNTLIRALVGVDRKRLQTAPTTPFPTMQPTILSAVAFLALHESYHVGQVSYARRLLGLPGLVDMLVADSAHTGS